MDTFKAFFKGLSDWVGRMTPSQVMMLLGLSAGSIVGAVMLFGWVNSVTYSRLYANLDAAEAGEVVNWLNDNQIPYQLSDNGSSIDIPQDDVYRARLSLAAEGLPRGGTVGYSVFDQNNLGMTDFLQNLNFRRALEGELTRTIMQLKEVQAARVHIVMPKDRLFKEAQEEATASVLLKLRGSGRLTAAQLDGITHLVSASVEGLEPPNIAIIDYNGNLLSGGKEADPVAGLTANQLEARKQIEQHLESKAQTMLDRVLGPNTAIVRVTADLNFAQREQTSESFDPNQQIVRSEELTRSDNQMSDKPAEEAESTESGSSETTVTNYEIGKTVAHLVEAVGSIERLSIAVMVDGTYEAPPADADGAAAPVYQPRTQEDLDRLAAIVKNAVGFDSQRNDAIEMVNVPFNQTDLDLDRQALDSMYLQQFWWDVGKNVGLVLLAVFALFWLRKRASKLFKALGQIAPAPRPAPTPAPAPAPAAEPATAAVSTADASFGSADQRQPTLVDHMQKAAREHPDEIAKVIRTMMADS